MDLQSVVLEKRSVIARFDADYYELRSFSCSQTLIRD